MFAIKSAALFGFMLGGEKNQMIENNSAIDYLNSKLKPHGFKYHHTAIAYGYEKRTGGEFRVEPYNGKFGTGFVVHCPKYDSSAFHYIRYFLKEK